MAGRARLRADGRAGGRMGGGAEGRVGVRASGRTEGRADVRAGGRSSVPSLLTTLNAIATERTTILCCLKIRPSTLASHETFLCGMETNFVLHRLPIDAQRGVYLLSARRRTTAQSTWTTLASICFRHSFSRVVTVGEVGRTW